MSKSTDGKNWSYAQVTSEAEKQIRDLMKKAEGMPEGDVFMVRQWAFGVFVFWDNLTMGWREPGDGDRMRRLTEWK
jgi:hypothetical protein